MPAIIITQSENGSSVTAAVGGVAALHLAENPTTGTSDRGRSPRPSAKRACVAIRYESICPPTGVHEWRFRIADPGTHQLRLRLRREWEDEAAATSRFTVDIVAD